MFFRGPLRAAVICIFPNRKLTIVDFTFVRKSVTLLKAVEKYTIKNFFLKTLAEAQTKDLQVPDPTL